jgi:hypothetical protein
MIRCFWIPAALNLGKKCKISHCGFTELQIAP